MMWRECACHVQWPNGDITEVPSLGQLLRTLAANPDTRAVRDELTQRELELVDAIVLARVMSPPVTAAPGTNLSVNHTADGKCRLSLTNGSVTLCAVLAQDEANQIAGWLCAPSKGDA